ncbi:MAG TPA: prolipoprotein diacylglyceryl transferase [Sedimentisphaerales bacterium]|jgi:phosphatidylglycerol:prolipoprotein diacylglycerol transferase|nr:prolipoprotein diacylglyceryl transferase [Sedimentisphaerales bacterium]HNU29685.1 prolipoprotein diacylglyceryl transferase [Sedimentisphaerales bacterium]
MHPELFEIPIVHLTVKSYGFMMVVGFLAAVTVIRHLSRHFTRDPMHITNAALYSLIAGVVGARIFFVIHYYDQFHRGWTDLFAIWNGGLELIGGVVLAIAVIVFYIRYHKLPMCHYLDVLAIGLTTALIFGRIGCFLNGCCYGKPTDLPWAIEFPYGSFAYESQVGTDIDRGRLEPRLHLPEEYFGYVDERGDYVAALKPWKYLTPAQQEQIARGTYRCLPVHPTQLYSSLGAALLTLILYGIWRRSQKAETAGRYRLLTRPGTTFSIMFILYGIGRFGIEMLRDDNPFEAAGLTIAQFLSMALAILGLALVVFFSFARPERLPTASSKQRERPGPSRVPVRPA